MSGPVGDKRARYVDVLQAAESPSTKSESTHHRGTQSNMDRRRRRRRHRHRQPAGHGGRGRRDKTHVVGLCHTLPGQLPEKDGSVPLLVRSGVEELDVGAP